MTGIRSAAAFLALASLSLISCAPEQPSRPEPVALALMQMPGVPRSLEYRGTDEAGLGMIREKVREYEQLQQKRACGDVQFVGYDHGNFNAPPASGKFKAIAMSTCGPSYYWFDQTEHSGRVSRLSISPRVLEKGDHTLVPGSYGKWELVRKR